jgi:hypothetical protein
LCGVKLCGKQDPDRVPIWIANDIIKKRASRPIAKSNLNPLNFPQVSQKNLHGTPGAERRGAWSLIGTSAAPRRILGGEWPLMPRQVDRPEHLFGFNFFAK